MGIDLDALLAKAKARMSELETITQPVILGEQSVGVKLTALPVDEWRLFTLHHPPRADVVLDMRAGVNLDDAVRAWAGVVLVDGDEVDDLTGTDDEGKSVYRWPEVYAALERPDRANLAMALWMIHDSRYQEAVKLAGKASTTARKKKPS